MKTRKTNHGFRIAEFIDSYGSHCSIQESSIATQPAIWLGVVRDEENRKVVAMNRDGTVAFHVGSPLPAGRMHVDRRLARQLIRQLQHFVDTGLLE